jgi:hypothetical protein
MPAPPRERYSNYGWKDFLCARGCRLAEETGAGGNFATLDVSEALNLAARVAGRVGFAGFLSQLFGGLSFRLRLLAGAHVWNLKENLHPLLESICGLWSFSVFLDFLGCAH